MLQYVLSAIGHFTSSEYFNTRSALILFCTETVVRREYLKTDIRFLVIQKCQTSSHILENAPFQNPAKHKTSKPSNNYGST